MSEITTLNLDGIERKVEEDREETQNERKKRLIELREKLGREIDVIRDRCEDKVFEIDQLIQKINRDSAIDEAQEDGGEN